MPESVRDDPCVLFALRRETGPFRRQFRPQQRLAGAPCGACFCGPTGRTVVVLETGVGRQRTRAALEWLLGRPPVGKVPYRPRVVLSAGFCGALDEKHRVGDVILATEVTEDEGRSWPTTWPGELPPGAGRPPLHRGRLVTTDRLLAGPEDKRDLGKRHGAAAVDMESAAVADLCSRAGVPFACVRAVSDDAHTSLSPRLVALLSGGRVSPWRLLANLASSPRLAGELWRLARDTRVAAERLGTALAELLTLTRKGDGF